MVEDLNKLFIQLKNAEGKAIFPRIDLNNVEQDSLLKSDLVKVGDTTLTAKLAAMEKTHGDDYQTLLDNINGINKFNYTVVDALPAVDAAEQYTIYFVPQSGKGEAQVSNDIYDEYLLLVDAEGTRSFELIGNTELDLSGYMTTEEIEAAIEAAIAAAVADISAELAKKVDKTTTVNLKPLSSNIVLDGTDIKLGDYSETSYLKFTEDTTLNAALSLIDQNFESILGGADGGNGDGGSVVSRVAQLESITKGYTEESAIKNDVASKLNKTATVNGLSFVDDAVTVGGANVHLTGYTKGTAAAVAVTDTVNAAIGKLEAKVDGIVDDTSFKDYAVNGVKFSEDSDNNLAVDGSTIKLTGYTSDVDGADKFTATDTLNAAFVTVDKEFASISDALGNKADSSALADVSDDVTNLGGRVDDIETVLEGLLEEGKLKDYIDTELAKKADKATTLAGYGITDAYTTSEIDAKIGDEGTITKAVAANTANFDNYYTKTVADTTFVKAVDGLNAVYFVEL